MEKLYNIDALEIQKYQQNRYPMLFVDMITEALPGKYAEGYKNFTYNEWFFPPHFEDEPVVPGCVLMEALTQVFLMSFLMLDECKGKKTGYRTIKSVNFYQKVIPGNQMITKAELLFYRHGLAKGTARGYVDEKLVIDMELMIAVPDILLAMLPKRKLPEKSGGVLNGQIIKDIYADQIFRYQLNRHPWFFCDCITYAMPGNSAEGIKKFTNNPDLPYPQFTDCENIPEFILTEAMIQVYLMCFMTLKENEGGKALDRKIVEANFYDFVRPGDVLETKANLISYRRGVARGIAKGYVGERLIADLELIVVIQDSIKQFLPQ